jgi:3-isopropylmalate/(R)-2-methylmalate dehydratase small subunit
MNWKKRGHVHLLGDNVPHDGGVMAFDIVLSRTNDPEKLIPQLFAELDPGLAQRLRPGDIIVAGRNFLAGKAHNAGIIALKALDISILCESMSVRAFQGVVALAVPALIQCDGITRFAADGDEVVVDFESGAVTRVATGETRHYPALAPEIRRMVEAGGMHGMLAAHLQAHPALATPRSSAA